MLHTPLEKTPFLPQEGPPLAPRRACSQTKKGVFSNVEGRKKETRGKVDRGDLPQPLRRRGAPSCYIPYNSFEGGEAQAATSPTIPSKEGSPKLLHPLQFLRRRGAPSCYEKTIDICISGYIMGNNYNSL